MFSRRLQFMSSLQQRDYQVPEYAGFGINDVFLRLACESLLLSIPPFFGHDLLFVVLAQQNAINFQPSGSNDEDYIDVVLMLPQIRMDHHKMTDKLLSGRG
jgi:hypothetical protein